MYGGSYHVVSCITAYHKMYDNGCFFSAPQTGRPSSEHRLRDLRERAIQGATARPQHGSGPGAQQVQRLPAATDEVRELVHVVAPTSSHCWLRLQVKARLRT